MNTNLPANNPPGFNNQAGIPVYGNNKPVSFLSRDNLFNIATIAVFVATIIFSNLIALLIIGEIIFPLAGLNVASRIYSNHFLRNLIIATVPVSTFFILAMLNKVTFKDGKFFNKSGQDLSDRLPVKFAKVWLRFSLMGVFILAMATKFIDIVDNDFFLMFFLISVSISLLYFVILNCPMSILINKEALARDEEVLGAIKGNYTPVSSSTSRSTYSDYSYRYLSTNFFHRK